MLDLPMITIITVVYNGVDSLAQTIENVSEIDYPNLSFLVIDGGSKDGTVDLIKKNQDKISYWVSEPDKGIYDAMNKGWAKADNDSYVLFLGSGDKVYKLPDMKSHTGEVIIYGNVELGEKGLFRSTVGARSFFGNTVHHQALLVKKSIHPAPPFSLKYKVYADFDFNQRLMKAGHKFSRDNDFYSYALEGGVSAQINPKECLEIAKKNHGVFVYLLGILYYKLQKINGYRKNNSSNSSL